MPASFWLPAILWGIRYRPTDRRRSAGERRTLPRHQRIGENGKTPAQRFRRTQQPEVVCTGDLALGLTAEVIFAERSKRRLPLSGSRAQAGSEAAIKPKIFATARPRFCTPAW